LKLIADSDEAGHAFQSEAGHVFQSKAGRGSDLMSATLRFGLPLVEAAARGKPIFARDIAVFREIGGDGAFYFNGKRGAELAAALRTWLALWEKSSAPSSAFIDRLTWRQSTQRLYAAIQGCARIALGGRSPLIQPNSRPRPTRRNSHAIGTSELEGSS
jgi:hypothetical protein